MSISSLAESLGLSISTVSRALNGYTDVSARTRERVEVAAKAIGYQPHPVAHRLATGRTGAIALVSSLRSGNYLDATFSALLAGVSEALRPRGYFALSLVLPTGDDELPELERLLAGRLVDGVILARTRIEDPRVSLLQQRGLPFITHGRTQGNAPHAWVDADNVRAFFLATERLAGLGHRRIALINGQPQMTFAVLREQGFASAMHAFGLDPAACPVRHGEPTAADGLRIASELIAENHARQGHAAGPVTAMLCATDAMALGAMAAIRAAGLVVGRAISVMGYGNSEAGLYAEPPLSTIDHALVENGHHLAQLLLEQLQGGAPAASHRSHLAAVSLIVRQSDGPCPHTPTSP
ncbi:LacI family transcriptional regulator [Verminephrobacter aporrectodeae subsp. tuberculatae]|uniref:LacI family DNA-binding transcriptional regulator n=1 Tax=Verminephrobacter aporrectodeae TaxID=1110389 RepID=UPI002238DDA3|nr:substrate-binding domain-containing protein [Verminephrobacter aporrectodeae]MCW8206799.1 LacI family transcriptional regulator [Verminephrobacter aporrectodeae subsp. tuberculatae]